MTFSRIIIDDLGRPAQRLEGRDPAEWDRIIRQRIKATGGTLSAWASPYFFEPLPSFLRLSQHPPQSIYENP